MSSPLPDEARGPAVSSTSADRSKIARKWAYQVRLTAYIPLSQAEIESELLELVNRVFEAMTCEPMPTDKIATVGARLVELSCVTAASVRCTVDVLAGALLADPRLRRLDRHAERVTHLLGALAAGYASAIRSSTAQQQDNLHRALLEAMWRCQRELTLSEARLGEVLRYVINGIAITDLDGRFVRTNAALGRVLNPSAGPSEQGARPTLFDSIRGRGGPDLRPVYRELADGSCDSLALRLDLAQDNEVLPVSLSASLLRDPDGEAREFVTVLGSAGGGQGVVVDQSVAQGDH